ncbi:COG4648 family protein [Litchfieldella rifensis]|uniref:DNA gyrase subunit B n=1 Tax=Litchfieldella rifensis TaxID=762643 RepID=A0ABV7LRV9_9GAMM
MLQQAIKWLGTLLIMAWPVLVFVLHDYLGSWPLLAAGAALLAWRMPQARYLALVVATFLLTLGGLGHAELGMRAYPVAVNAMMLAVFLTSLWQGMPIVERLARLREPELSPAGIHYTRRVTWAWCGFFVFNGTIAGWTALYADLATWSLYNGVISYGLIGLMFAGEWLLRRRLRRTVT